MSAMTVEAIDSAVLTLLVKRRADPWQRTRRPNQTPPEGDWRTWLVMAGRGFGKTRTGAEWIRERVLANEARLIALVAPTAADARDVMVQGESGLLACCERVGLYGKYQPSRRRVIFPNGAQAFTYSADEPDRLRGPQHDTAWSDEISSWRYPDSWDMLQFGLRLGVHPRQIATTTPKPVALVRALVEQAKHGDVIITRGSTHENASHLAPSFLTEIERRYGGSRLGRQEIEGELLEDVEGAFWNRALLDSTRVREAPELQRIVVAVDPATTHGEDADFTGIAVAGVGFDQHVYVIHAEQVRLSPDGWARRVIDLYDRHRADAVIAERNQGGEMVEHTIRTVRRSLRITTVHASRGKTVRAEPVVALYEQGRAHHVGTFAELEDQMCSFPVAVVHEDILDAVVYAVTDLDEGSRVMLRGRA